MLRSGFWCNLDPKKQNLTLVSTRNLLFVIFFVLSPETLLLVIPNKACPPSQGRCSHKSWGGTWDIMPAMNLIRSPVLSISKHLSRLQMCLLFPRTFHQVSLKEVKKYIYIQSNEIHNVVALIKCLLILRCQLYMFRTVTVHPQELLL